MTTQIFIGLFTEDGLDQICETEQQASAERKDLISVGCKVSVYRAADELTLYAIDEWIRDGISFATARNRVEAGYYAQL